VRCLFTIKSDGTTLRQLTLGRNQTDEQPAWAPDATHLVFVSNRTGSRQLWTVSILDGKLVQLTTVDGSLDPQNPSWSPDGVTIAFASHSNLYLIMSDGSKLRPFVLGGKAAMPDWSPDGASIVYVDGETIWVRSADGLTSTPIGTYRGTRNPRWAPDGTRIIFSARDANDYQHLYLVDSLGAWLRQVTIGVSDDITPDW
jgi:TolB protein